MMRTLANIITVFGVCLLASVRFELDVIDGLKMLSGQMLLWLGLDMRDATRKEQP